MPDQEMIAVKLDALAQAIAQATGIMACCVRTPNLTEVGIPYHAMPFWFTGEIYRIKLGSEGANPYTQSVMLSIPQGQSGIITGFGIGEHFPGEMAGVRVSLLVNGEAVPAFPRVSGLLGFGTGQPFQTWIPLPGSAEVSIMVDTIWTTSGNNDVLQYGIPFSIKGYYMDQEYFAAAQNNAAAPIGAVSSDPTNYRNIQIPEANIATSSS